MVLRDLVVMPHFDNERKPATTIWDTLQLAVRDHLYTPSHRQGSTDHAFVIPVVDHCLKGEIAQ